MTCVAPQSLSDIGALGREEQSCGWGGVLSPGEQCLQGQSLQWTQLVSPNNLGVRCPEFISSWAGNWSLRLGELTELVVTLVYRMGILAHATHSLGESQMK